MPSNSPARMDSLSGYPNRTLNRIFDYDLATRQLYAGETLVIELLPQHAYRIICTYANWESVEMTLRSQSATDFKLHAVKF